MHETHSYLKYSDSLHWKVVLGIAYKLLMLSGTLSKTFVFPDNISVDT